MSLAILTLFTGLAISAVAIYYSVIGLAAIFSAAVIPIVVMGAILEVSKLVAAWWLKANWHRAPFLLKSYMLVAVVVLMLITSMGIFGFLSKAHTDQAITTGDVTSQVALYDEQINVERDNIANAKSLIAQMDATVQGIIANGESREIKLKDGRTYQRSAAEHALQIRRSQAKDRARFTEIIEQSQAKILELQQKKAPIAADLREVEAKVGPIKYIAQLIYGDNPDNNLLEKAVTWVIITIVFVFDPLAVLLLLASQMSFQWAKKEKEERKDVATEKKDESDSDGRPEDPDRDGPPDGTDPGSKEPVPEEQTNNHEQDEKISEELPVSTEEPSEQNDKSADPGNSFPTFEQELQGLTEDLNQKPQEEDEIDDEDILEDAAPEVKKAMKNWKHDHPNDSLKRQKKLLARGIIKELPWEKYLKAKADYEDQDAEEAAKWALEQIEKKQYQQNEEQSEESLWKKIQDTKK